MRKSIHKLKIIFTCLLLSFLFSPSVDSLLLSARKTTVTVSGKVVDKKKKPVPMARIQLHLIQKEKNVKKFLVFTDKKGRWKAKGVPKGQLLMLVSAPGYISRTRKFGISDMNMRFTLSLKKDESIFTRSGKKFALIYLEPKERNRIDMMLFRNKREAAEKFCMRLKGNAAKSGLMLIGYNLFNEGKFEDAKHYFELADSKNWYHLMGGRFARLHQYETALPYYEKAMPSGEQADFFKMIAADYTQKGNTKKAVHYYNKSIKQYETLIKSHMFSWNPDYITGRGTCKAELVKLTGPDKSQSPRLKTLLKKAGNYCKKLEDSAIYFFSKERIVEQVNTFDEYMDASSGRFRRKTYRDMGSGTRFKRRRTSVISTTNRFLYELQLIKDKEKIEEQRILLKKNSKNKRIENAGLETKFKIHDSFFGPSGLLNFYWQQFFDYKIIGKETLAGQITVILEALPMKKHDKNVLFGKVWLDEKDGSVVKIEWYPRSVPRVGKRKNSKISPLPWNQPTLHFISQYDVKNNGIRFPSLYSVEEFIISNQSKKIVGVKMDIDYFEHRFFRVNTDVSYDNK